MEVTVALSGCARRAGFDFGSDTALVAVQHMLCQTVDLFKALGWIGLRPENIFALGKIYSNSAPVIEAIRSMGATVIESSTPKPGQFDEAFEQDIKHLWETVAERIDQARIKRIIVLDDGGRCVINIPHDLLSRYPVSGVEQTSLGMFVFEEIPPPFVVFSWARSAVKLQIGGHIFSHCLINRLQAEFLRGKSLTGVQIGIVGLGSIGRSLADIVERQENSIAFYDPAPDLKVPRCLGDRLPRLDSLEELMVGSEYVFGASGRNPFNGCWPMAHRPGIKLFSGSGGDQEFGPIICYLQHGPSFKVEENTWDITSVDGPCGPMRIAYLGFPYNFVSRAESAVPTHIVQLETAGLLSGLIQARSYLDLIEDGGRQQTGIRRISPDAQRFIYNSWLHAMKNRGIDIRKLYGYDSSLLAAPQHSDWLAQNTEPCLPATNASVDRVEAWMKAILNGRCQPAR